MASLRLRLEIGTNRQVCPIKIRGGAPLSFRFVLSCSGVFWFVSLCFWVGVTSIHLNSPQFTLNHFKWVKSLKAVIYRFDGRERAICVDFRGHRGFASADFVIRGEWFQIAGCRQAVGDTVPIYRDQPALHPVVPLASLSACGGFCWRTVCLCSLSSPLLSPWSYL